jgi:glycosyltransferase involved in cell wall biosynthesis
MGFHAMRLLIATDAWAPQINGVVRTLEHVVRGAERYGCTVEVVSPDRFASIPMPGYPEIRLAFASARRLKRIARAFSPDVVYVATEGPIGLAARRAAMALDLPLATSFHTRFPEYLRARAPIPLRVSYAAMRWFHRPSRAVLVSTESLRAELERRGLKNLTLWSFGVDLSQFAPRAADAARHPRPVFLNVGRLAVEKNLEAFLSLDLPGTKVVVGEGPARAALEKRYPEAIFLGALTGAALAEAYAQADVFVFPSRTDTFGLVTLEALASGVPVAAFPVMGPRDILAGTRAGVLSDDLREAALRCLSLDRAACLKAAAAWRWEASMEQFFAAMAATRRSAAASQPESLGKRPPQPALSTASGAR